MMKRITFLLIMILSIFISVKSIYADPFLDTPWTVSESPNVSGNYYINKSFDIDAEVVSISLYLPDDMLYGPFLPYIDGLGVNPSRVIFYNASNSVIGTTNFVDVTSTMYWTWVDFTVPDNTAYAEVMIGVTFEFPSELLIALESAIGYQENRTIYNIFYYANGNMFYTLKTSSLFIGDRQPIYPVIDGYRFAGITYLDGTPFDFYLDVSKANANNQIYLIVNYDKIVDADPPNEPQINWLVSLLASIGIDNKFALLIVLLIVFVVVIVIVLILDLNILIAALINLVISSILFYYGLIGFIEIIVILMGSVLMYIFRRMSDE